MDGVWRNLLDGCSVAQRPNDYILVAIRITIQIQEAALTQFYLPGVSTSLVTVCAVPALLVYFCTCTYYAANVNCIVSDFKWGWKLVSMYQQYHNVKHIVSMLNIVILLIHVWNMWISVTSTGCSRKKRTKFNAPQLHHHHFICQKYKYIETRWRTQLARHTRLKEHLQ